MKIVLCGGGTAGHIMPNVALLDNLRERGCSVSYVGVANGMEQRIAERYGVPFYAVPAVKFHRKKIWRNFKIPFTLFKCVGRAKKVLRDIKPDVIFSKGGYAALPAALAGRKLKIPVVCHESDKTLGVANKMSAVFCKKVILSAMPKKLKKNQVVIGNPLRGEIFRGDKNNIIRNYNVTSPLPRLLIVGGSGGAAAINRFIAAHLSRLTEKYFVVHITGKNYVATRSKNYVAVDYAENIADFYDFADYVISRAGANAVDELYALAKKCILIPLPESVSRGDQKENAEKLTATGQAVVIAQEKLNLPNLNDALEKLRLAPPVISRYDREIPKKIVDVTLSVIGERK